jgi:hypothetical protein
VQLLGLPMTKSSCYHKSGIRQEHSEVCTNIPLHTVK